MQQTHEDFPHRCFASNVGVFSETDTPVKLFIWIADCLKHGDGIFNKEVRNINERNTAEDENISEDPENAEPSAVGFHEKGGLCDHMIRYFIQIVEEEVTNHEEDSWMSMEKVRVMKQWTPQIYLFKSPLSVCVCQVWIHCSSFQIIFWSQQTTCTVAWGSEGQGRWKIYVKELSVCPLSGQRFGHSLINQKYLCVALKIWVFSKVQYFSTTHPSLATW